MNFILVDLEATCWATGTSPARQEITEIGAARVRAPHYQVADTFQRFVRPTREPALSEYCTALTGIRQTDVDGAETFPRVFAEFLAWIGPGPFRPASWGAYDLKQLTIECERCQLALPAGFADHLNLKTAFASLKGVRPCGMKFALSLCGLPLAGRHHRALDDVLNIARLAEIILPAMT